MRCLQDPCSTLLRGGQRAAALPCTDDTLTLLRAQDIQNYLFASLCGLWFGHDLYEQRSGMVLVPSIMSEPHISQRRPVGRALIAVLHVGQFEHEKNGPKRPRRSTISPVLHTGHATPVFAFAASVGSCFTNLHFG